MVDTNGKRIEMIEDIATLKEQMHQILTNDLPHLSKKANWSIGIGASILIAVVISIILDKL